MLLPNRMHLTNESFSWTEMEDKAPYTYGAYKLEKDKKTKQKYKHHINSKREQQQQML